MLLSFVCALGAPGLRVARADDPPADDRDAAPPRRRDASVGTILGGPFRSSRLFAMPVADVVGAFQLSLSGDASLLQEPGILTSAGVAAIGFGDVAQIEYRHTSAELLLKACPRCLSRVFHGHKHCPDCGAQIDHAAHGEARADAPCPRCDQPLHSSTSTSPTMRPCSG